MKVEIDQSGKIEDTSKHTVLAFSNTTNRCVLITAKEKRRLQEKFRLLGKPRLFVDATFAVTLYLLVKPILKSYPVLIVDVEYPGHTLVISEMFATLTPVEVSLRWERIGKQSKTHDIAYKSYRKKIKPDKILTADDI